MCKVCDNQLEFARDIVSDLQTVSRGMEFYRALEASRVFCEHWKELTRRALELACSNNHEISQQARQVLRQIDVSGLKKRISGTVVNNSELASDVFTELEVDDPFRNKARFAEIKSAIWDVYFAHAKETQLKPDIVKWIAGFATLHCLPVIEQLVLLKKDKKEEVRRLANLALQCLEVETLEIEVDAVLRDKNARRIAVQSQPKLIQIRV